MTTTIRVSDEIKDRLERLKRDDETYNELLDRLSRAEKDVDAIAGSFDRPEDDGLAESVSQAYETLSQSLDDRTERPRR